MAKNVKRLWTYGDTPPKDYKELGQVIKDLTPPKKKPNKLAEKPDQLLKDKR